MEAQSEKKGRGAGRVILKVLLWLILTPIILAVVLAGSAYAYLSLSKVPSGPIDKIAAMEPMPVEERIAAVDPANKTFTLAVDAADAAFVAIKAGLIDELLEQAEDALKDNDAVLESYGFEIDNGRVTAGAKLTYKGFLPVPVRAVLTPGFKDGKLVLYLDSVGVGKLLSVPKGLFSLKEGEPVYTLQRRLHPRMQKLTDVVGSGDKVLLTFAYEVDKDLIAEIASSSVRTKYMSKYLDMDVATLVLTNQYNYDDTEKPYRQVMDAVEAEPYQLMELKGRILSFGSTDSIDAFFAERDDEYQARFFPGASREAVAAMLTENEAAANENRASIEALCKKLYAAYQTGEITVTENAVLLNGEKPTVAGLMGGEACFIEEGSLIPLLLEKQTDPKYPFPAKTEGLPKLADVIESEAAAQGLSGDSIVPLGLAYRQKNGFCVQAYMTDADTAYYEPIGAEIYGTYEKSGTVPIWQQYGVMPSALKVLTETAKEQGYDSLDNVTELTIGASCTEMQTPSWVRYFAEAANFYLPNLELLDLRENPYQNKNTRGVFNSYLPTLTVLYPRIG